MIGDEESTPESGVLTSPNFNLEGPNFYPNDHDSTQTIQVAEGKIIKMTLTNFDTEWRADTLEIWDNDGTNLAPLSLCEPKLSGSSVGPGVPSAGNVVVFTSNSNIVHVKFHTDTAGQRTGWRLEWTER